MKRHNYCIKIGRDVKLSRCIDCHPKKNGKKFYRNCKVRGKEYA